MTTFGLYLSLGFDHISDVAAYDHILFLLALCAVYGLKDCKRILILVTAFTIGHTLTLALATLKILPVPVDLIEFLIPLTIFLTGFWNVLSSKEGKSKLTVRFKYGAALFFGLIHGMGFSSYLRSLLGSEESIIIPLLAFNIGIELGQILVVLLILILAFLLVDVLRVKRRDWNLILSGAAMGVSFLLCVERWPF